jgi:hypothetical protein
MSTGRARTPARGRFAALGAAILLSGCAWLGPEIVRSGRPAYNDAILATSDQQLLQNIVRLRFHDSVGFLSVASITANVSVTAGGTVNVGVGSSSGYAGNLVPLAGTVTTEQNPTISYVPVSGDQLLRQFATEIPLERAILIVNSATDRRQVWRALVRRVNDIRNPDFPDPPWVVVDPRFERLVDLAAALQERGVLYWVRLAGGATGFGIVLHSYAPASVLEVEQLLGLLGIAKAVRAGEDIVVPVQLSVGSAAPGSMVIEARSVLELMRLAAAGIEMPGDVPGAARFRAAGPAGQGIRILATASEPQQARVAARYRDRWFYVADDDEASKQWFNMLQLLASAQLPESAAGSVPVLTIPVTSRR